MFIKNLISQRGTKPNVFLFFICLVSFSLSLSGQSLFNSLEKNTKTPAQKQNYQPQVKTLENQIPSLSTYREDLKQVDPDFAVWLDKQIEIMEMQVRSLNFDLANLSPKSDRYSIVIESQLEDLEYLLKTVREKSEFLIKDSAFNIQKKTISITDYGNLEEIKKNASPFLKKAIAESQRSGRNRIIFPDGVFKFNDLNNTDFAAAGQHLLSYRNAAMVKKNKTGKQIVSHIPLVGVSNLSITGGKETKFLFMHAQTGIFILQSKNILIKNIKFDYNIPHYTQGTIEKIVDKQTYILKIEEGFPPATLKPFKNMKGFHPVVRTAHGDTIENGRYPWGAPVGSYHNYTKIDDLGNNRYRCRLNKPIASRLKPGTRAIYYFRKVGHGNPVYVEDSDSVFFDNIAMYSGFAAGFIKYIRSGFLMIKNSFLGVRPGTNRLASNNADGSFNHYYGLGSFLLNNTFELVGDDYINIHATRRSIQHRLSDTELLLPSTGAWPKFKEGDVAMLLDPDPVNPNNAVYEGKITRIEYVRWEENNFPTRGARTPKLFIKFTFDKALPKDLKTIYKDRPKGKNSIYWNVHQLINKSSIARGTIIHKNKFIYGISRTLLSGRCMLFTDNHTKNNLLFPVNFYLGDIPHGDATSLQHSDLVSQNIKVAGNIWDFRHPTTGLTIGSNLHGRNRSQEIMISHIYIENNTLKNIQKGTHAVARTPGNVLYPINVFNGWNIQILKNDIQAEKIQKLLYVNDYSKKVIMKRE